MTCPVKMMNLREESNWTILDENRKRGNRCPHDEWVWVEDEKYPQRDGKRLDNNSCWYLMTRYEHLVECIYGTLLNGVSITPSLVESSEDEMLAISRQLKERKEYCSFLQGTTDYLDFLEVNREKIQQRKQENLAAYASISGKQDCDQ